MGQAQAKQSKPLDDLSYDLVTMLHQKSKALEAYDKYLADASSDQAARQAIEAIRNDDLRAIEQLKGLVAQRLGGSAAGGAGIGMPMTQGSGRGATASSQDVAGHPKRSGAV